MTEHRIASQEEWQAERDELLRQEKELTRRGDDLARKRRELPWVPVETEYRFHTEQGIKTLAELFGGRSQLLVYHFMFGPPYSAGCPVCSSIADTLTPQAPHLKARDTTLLLASRGPLDRRSEEHTSELQSHVNLVCRLLLEKKKINQNQNIL